MFKKDEFFREAKEAPITYIIVAINIIAFIVLEILGGTQNTEVMLKHGAMNPHMITEFGQWYRLFTCIFLHFGIEHLFNNMLLLFFLGQIFEKAVGSRKFTIVYLCSGLVGSFLSFMYQCLMAENDLVAGASGAIFGVVGGMIVVIIVNKGKYSGISLKRMMFMAILTLYFGFVSVGTDNVGHVAGILTGVILTFWLYGVPIIFNKLRDRHNKPQIDFVE